MVVVVVSAAAMDQDHTSSWDDLINQDYRCWNKDCIDVARSKWLSRLHGRNINNLFCFLVWNRHLFNDQKHNIYHITLVDWLPSHSTVDQWLATSQGMSTL